MAHLLSRRVSIPSIRQLRSFHSAIANLDSATQQLIASAQSTARQLRSLQDGRQVPPEATSDHDSDVKSVKRQAMIDLTQDQVMASSLKAQRKRATALTVPIPQGVRQDVPLVSRRLRKRRPRHQISRSSDATSSTTIDTDLPNSPTGKGEEAHDLSSGAERVQNMSAVDQNAGTISARNVRISKIKPPRKMQIARLRRSLGRVLFSPGVQPLRDVRTGVWNFDPSLHDIPKPEEFAFERCPAYITPSQDSELLQLARQHQCQFLGSTSTLTKALSQIYFAISGGKGIDLATLSQDFTTERNTFTPGAELPASLIITKTEGTEYSVDSDKSMDVENVISDFVSYMGRILEKMLTAEVRDFKRFLRSSPDEAVSQEERNQKEAYQYQKSGSLIMRSQLDCYDPRLPGTGVFDIKTRACLPVRYDRANYLANSAYDIWKERGYTQSFEREYYDLLRAGMLKFSLQVRIGAMDGIFLAYHNTARIYGFQYIPLSEIDQRLFGSTELAEQAFKLSIAILEKLLQRCVDAFPDKSVAVILKRSPGTQAHTLTAYVEPQDWDEALGQRPTRAITFNMRNLLDKEVVNGPIMLSADDRVRKAQDWSVEWNISESTMDEAEQAKARRGQARLRQELVAMNSLYVPDGQSVKSMTRRSANARGNQPPPKKEALDEDVPTPEAVPETTIQTASIRWKEPGPRQLQLRKEAKESGRAYERRKKTWRKGKMVIMSTA